MPQATLYNLPGGEYFMAALLRLSPKRDDSFYSALLAIQINSLVLHGIHTLIGTNDYSLLHVVVIFYESFTAGKSINDDASLPS